MSNYDRTPCVYCGDVVTSTNPDVDYCRGCYYSGAAMNAQFAQLIAELPTDSYWWHTGGGCFALRIDLGGSCYLMATADGDATPPDSEDGPWWLGRYDYDEATDDMRDESIVAEHLDRAALIAAVITEVAR